MTTMEWVGFLRSMINPLYAEQEGTESHERKTSADMIDALKDEVVRFRELASNMGLEKLIAENERLRFYAQILADHGLRVDDSCRFDEWWEKHARFADHNRRKACRAAYDFGRGAIDIDGQVVGQEAAR